MPERDPSVEIGVVARAHGIRGELRIELHNPASTALDRAEVVVLGGESHGLANVRPVNKAILIRLEGIDSRTDAERFKGMTVEVNRDCIELDEDDVLLTEMIGLEALLTDGTGWGRVIGIETGPQVRLIIERDSGRCELPLVDAFVLSVDLDTQTMVVDPPEGLPEFEA